MKKLFFTMLVVLVSMSAMAQDKKYGLGFNLLYGTEIENIGFGVKGQYYATDKVRLEADADYFMKNDNYGASGTDITLWDVNVNAHYLIPVASDKAFVYPLVGVGITDWHYSAFDDKVKFAINLGAGFQFDVADDFAISAEAKYQIIQKFNQAVFAIGAVYKF